MFNRPDLGSGLFFPVKETIKKIAVQFFCWWYNQQGGTNTEEAFEKWWAKNQSEFPLPVSNKEKQMQSVLERIANWELPATNQYWYDDKTRPVGYEAAYGSNGVRDYFKGLAADALKIKD